MLASACTRSMPGCAFVTMCITISETAPLAVFFPGVGLPYATGYVVMISRPSRTWANTFRIAVQFNSLNANINMPACDTIAPPMSHLIRSFQHVLGNTEDHGKRWAAFDFLFAFSITRALCRLIFEMETM